MTILIKELDEWSNLQNKSIKIFNKPKDKGRTAFAMTLSPRIVVVEGREE